RGLEGPIGPGRVHPLTAPDRCPAPRTAAAIDEPLTVGSYDALTTEPARPSHARLTTGPATWRTRATSLGPWISDPPAASRCAWPPAWPGSSSPRPCSS